MLRERWNRGSPKEIARYTKWWNVEEKQKQKTSMYKGEKRDYKVLLVLKDQSGWQYVAGNEGGKESLGNYYTSY